MIFFVYLYLNVHDYALAQIGSSQKLVSTVGSKNTAFVISCVILCYHECINFRLDLAQ